MSLSVRLIVDLIGIKNSEVPHHLGAEALGERGRVDDVAKQNRHLLHLAGKRGDLPAPWNLRQRPQWRGAPPSPPHRAAAALLPAEFVSDRVGRRARWADGAERRPPHSPQNFMPGGFSAWHRVPLITGPPWRPAWTATFRLEPTAPLLPGAHPRPVPPT